MRLTKITKRFLAFGLAFAMVVTGVEVGTVNVSAAKKAKKSAIALSKKKMSVQVGTTSTLTVKNAKKKVKWSTSNKKIVKISKVSGKKKSTVKFAAKKTGKAVITAKVGGKKLKCTVSVVKAGIKSVSVDALDATSLIVKMPKKTSLNASGIKVEYKWFNEGKFNQKAKVDAISTTDQKTYRVYLDSYIDNGYVVKVTIGKKTKTIQNKQKFRTVKDYDSQILLEKDVVVVKELGEYLMNAIGDCKYSLKKGNKLPKGMKLVGNRGIIKGIPTTVGDTTFTLVVKDELGRSTNLKLTVKVYDDQTVAVKDQKTECRMDDYVADRNTVVTPGAIVDAKNCYKAVEVAPVGGSGKYKFSLSAPDLAGAVLSTDKKDAAGTVTQEAAESTKIYVPYSITAGDHICAVTITDVADPARTTTANITITGKEYLNVSGSLLDSTGAASSENDEIYFIPKDAVSFNEYINKRTYEKYEMTRYDGDDSIFSEKMIAGNTQEDAPSSYKGDQATDTIRYKVYSNYFYSAKTGPLPYPEVLTEAPTTAPTAEVADSAASPAVTPFVVPAVEKSKYTAEIPAGEYIVKVGAANDVRYQTVSNVTVSADGEVNLQMPIRFSNVSAVATYANGNPVVNERIYFENKKEQYEGWNFSVRTNYEGKFSASLPEGTYSAYVLNEGKKAYFTTDITVGNETDLALPEFKLAISKSLVSGRLVTQYTQDDNTVKEYGEAYTKLYFFDANGKVTSTWTKNASDIKDANGNYVESPENGSFKLNLMDGAYTVRIKTNDDFITIGALNVAGNVADVKLVFDISLEKRFANASAINPDGAVVQYISNGNNDTMAKLTITEAGSYDFVASYTSEKTVGDMLSVYNAENDDVYLSNYYYNNVTGENVYVANLEAGTYYVNLDFVEYDEDDYYYDDTVINQKKGIVNMKVQKHQYLCEMYATEMTPGTPGIVNVTRNNPIVEMRGRAYIKVNATAGQKFEVTCSNTTLDTSFRLYVDKNGYESGQESNSAGDQIYTVTADEAGYVYIGFYGNYENVNNMAVAVSIAAK